MEKEDKIRISQAHLIKNYKNLGDKYTKSKKTCSNSEAPILQDTPCI